MKQNFYLVVYTIKDVVVLTRAELSVLASCGTFYRPTPPFVYLWRWQVYPCRVLVETGCTLSHTYLVWSYQVRRYLQLKYPNLGYFPITESNTHSGGVSSLNLRSLSLYTQGSSSITSSVLSSRYNLCRRCCCRLFRVLCLGLNPLDGGTFLCSSSTHNTPHPRNLGLPP